MFIGHFGIGFGAKPVAPKISLGTLFLAAQFLELLWPTLLLLGWERVRIVPGATVVKPFLYEITRYPTACLPLRTGLGKSRLGRKLQWLLVGRGYWVDSRGHVQSPCPCLRRLDASF